MNHQNARPSQESQSRSKSEGQTLRLVAWETTRNCNLACVHCRASAARGPFCGELGTHAGFRLLDQIAQAGNPIVILTGGEPLLRTDIFDIAKYGTDRGLNMVMALNGTLMTENFAKQMTLSGIRRISISLDGATSKSHDRFRGVDGAFGGALRGIRLAKNAGIEFQINTTVTKTNLHEIPKIQDLAVTLGAVAHHIFLLVPTGRGKYILDQEITAEEYENTLNWFYDRRNKTSLQLKATCAPHFYRILRQRAKKDQESISFDTHGMGAATRGCLAGTGFCFISHRGIVQPCGFLDVSCGDITRESFVHIWNRSDIFLSLRNFNDLKGKCGKCEFKTVCGGCRARAFEATGDFLAEEPLCSYQPRSFRKEEIGIRK